MRKILPILAALVLSPAAAADNFWQHQTLVNNTVPTQVTRSAYCNTSTLTNYDRTEMDCWSGPANPQDAGAPVFPDGGLPWTGTTSFVAVRLQPYPSAQSSAVFPITCVTPIWCLEPAGASLGDGGVVSNDTP